MAAGSRREASESLRASEGDAKLSALAVTGSQSALPKKTNLEPFLVFCLLFFALELFSHSTKECPCARSVQPLSGLSAGSLGAAQVKYIA